MKAKSKLDKAQNWCWLLITFAVAAVFLSLYFFFFWILVTPNNLSICTPISIEKSNVKISLNLLYISFCNFVYYNRLSYLRWCRWDVVLSWIVVLKWTWCFSLLWWKEFLFKSNTHTHTQWTCKPKQRTNEQVQTNFFITHLSWFNQTKLLGTKCLTEHATVPRMR